MAAPPAPGPGAGPRERPAHTFWAESTGGGAEAPPLPAGADGPARRPARCSRLLSAPTRWRPRLVPLGRLDILGPLPAVPGLRVAPGRLSSGPLGSQDPAVAGVSVLASSGPCKVSVNSEGQLSAARVVLLGRQLCSLRGLLEVWRWGEAVGTEAAKAFCPTPQ